MSGSSVFGFMKDPAQYVQPFRFVQVVQRDGMDDGHLVGEVGMHPDGLEIGHHQHGRVVQRLAVAQQLAIGHIQIPVQPLEFPGEVADSCTRRPVPGVRTFSRTDALERVPLLVGRSNSAGSADAPPSRHRSMNHSCAPADSWPRLRRHLAMNCWGSIAMRPLRPAPADTGVYAILPLTP